MSIPIKTWVTSLPLLLALILPTIAYADTTREETLKSEGVLEVSYHYASNEPMPSYDEIIQKGTDEYSLVNKISQSDPDYNKAKKEFSRTVTKVLTLSESQNSRAYFDNEVLIEEEEYVGNIPLTDSFDLTLNYQSMTRQVDRVETIRGLPDNDVERIPSSKAFLVTSDAYVDATQTELLYRSGVAYSVTKTDEFGLPLEYEATVTYRGQESYLVPDHYVVTAKYEGEIESNIEGMLLVIEYKKEEVALTDNPTLALFSQSSEGELAVSFPYLFAGIGVGIVGGLLGVIFWSTRRVRLYENTPNKIRKVESLTPITTKTGSRLEIEATIDPNKHTYFISVPKRYLKCGGNLEVATTDALYYSGPWEKKIDLASVQGTDILSAARAKVLSMDNHREP